MSAGPPAGETPPHGPEPGQGPPEHPPGALTRSREERALAGVCRGLGRFTNIDPVIYRVTFGLLTIAGGIGLLLYVMAWLLIPEEGRGSSEIERLLRRRVDPASAAPLLLIVLAVLIVLGFFAGGPGSSIIVVLAIAAVAALAARARGVDVGGALRGLTGGGRPSHPQERVPDRPEPGGQETYGSAAPGATAPVDPTGAGGDPPAGASPSTAPGPDAVPVPPEGGHRDSGTRPWPSPYEPAEPYVPAEPYMPAGSGRSLSRRGMAPSLISLGTLCAALAVGGTLAGLDASPFVELPLAATLGGVLLVLGVGLLLTTWRGGSPLLLVTGAVLTLALVSGTAVVQLSDTWGTRMGEVTWQPRTAQDIADPYRLAMGEARLNLTRLDGPATGGPDSKQGNQPAGRSLPSYDVTASVGAGELRVTLPRDAIAVVDARADAGEIKLPSARRGGFSNVVHRTIRPPEDAGVRIRLNLHTGAGEVKVRYAPS